MAKRREIRNITAEFLIFQIEGKEKGVEVYYKDKTIWCTQKAMGMLFDCSTDNVGLHLKNIFASEELIKDSVTEIISATSLFRRCSMCKNYTYCIRQEKQLPMSPCPAWVIAENRYLHEE